MIKLVVGAVAMLIMTVGIVIPIIESSAYDVLDNGKSDGLTFDLVGSDSSGVVGIERGSGVISFTVGDEVVTIQNEPMIIFASEFTCIFIDASGRFVIVHKDTVSSRQSASTMSWDDGIVRLDNGIPYTYGSFAYVPVMNGPYAFFNHGDLFLSSSPIVSVGAYGDYITQDWDAPWGAGYWNGTVSYGGGGSAWTGQYYVDISGDKLQSVSWRSPVGGASEVDPIEEISKDSLVDLGAQIGTGRVYAGGVNNSTYADAIFYDNGKCRITNYVYVQGEFEDSYVVWNDQQYTVAAIGDGTNPLTSSNEVNIRYWWDVEIIDDYAFYNVNVSDSEIPSPLVVGAHAFEGSNVEIPTLSSIWIEDYAFYNASSEIYLRVDVLNHVGAHAFENCDISLGIDEFNGIYLIGDSAFKNSSVSLEDLAWDLDYFRVRHIGPSAFEGCPNLMEYSNLNLGPYVESVGDRAFYGIGGVTTVEMNTPASFGENMFGDSSVEVINVYGGTVPTSAQIGKAVTLNVASDTVNAIGYIAESKILVEKDGLVYTLILLLPMFVLVGLVVGIAVESVRRK